jgi:hypothetical protein
MRFTLKVMSVREICQLERMPQPIFPLGKIFDNALAVVVGTY